MRRWVTNTEDLIALVLQFSCLECRKKNLLKQLSKHPPLTKPFIQQELAALRNQMSGQINVDMEIKPQVDLASIMADIREQYENVAIKNQKELEIWFQGKVRLDQNPGVFIY